MRTTEEERFITFCGKKRPTSDQQTAIFDKKSVVAAGAGSGKTATLSQRFVWLVMTGIPADRILTITFTKDAAASMKSKIFRTLHDAQDKGLFQNGENPLKDFSNSTICTTDSFCSEIARTDCVRYGIPSNFSIQDEEDLKKSSSDIVDYTLEQHKNDDLLKKYLYYFKIENIKKTFYELARNYICISNPIDTLKTISFFKNYKQKENERLSCVIDILQKYCDFLTENNKAEKISDVSAFESNYQSDKVKAIEILRNVLKTHRDRKNEHYVKDFKKNINEALDSLTLALESSKEENIELLIYICVLIDDYQKELLKRKKETGLVTFRDVMKMAIDILKTNEKVRKFYNDKFDAIMVDEFQDNNKDNKDLVYLLALNGTYVNGTEPNKDNINPEKIFMVGDEKQSIYMFRNADVSVFKGIAKELGNDRMCHLSENFRSEHDIIDIINRLFQTIMGTNNSHKYEADFEQLTSVQNKINPNKSIISFDYMIAGDPVPEKCLSEYQSEAYHIAERINEIVNINPEKYQIYEKKNNEEIIRNPDYSDIAVLLKNETHLASFENALRLFDIPIDSSDSKTLTQDAIANDFYTLFQLAIYGSEDEISTLAFLKSPFCNLTDKEIFSDRNSSYNKHSKIIDDLREYLKCHNLTQSVSYIWNELGYRYYVIAKDGNQPFEEHYDYIFKMACSFDDKNLTVIDFLDYLRPLIGKESKIDNLSIQKENPNGIRFMTIYKSKGLEFPIVIVANMQSNSTPPGPKVKLQDNDIVTIPYCFTIEENNLINPLFLEKNDDIQKENAEIKRLFYVAATRAQYHLIFSGVVPAMKDENTSFELLDEDSKHSMLDYLLQAVNFRYDTDPSFEGMEMNRYDYVKESDWIKKTDCSINKATDTFIYNTEPKPLRFVKNIIPVTEHENDEFDKSNPLDEIAVDSILQSRTEITEFGSLVHKMIENAILKNEKMSADFFEGNPSKEEIYNCADKLAKGFTNSTFFKDLSSFELQPEKAIMLVENGRLKNGVIDLLCIRQDKIIIVDYKTDKYKDPQIHREQLSAYKKAIEVIYPNRPVETYLFYLRSAEYLPL